MLKESWTKAQTSELMSSFEEIHPNVSAEDINNSPDACVNRQRAYFSAKTLFEILNINLGASNNDIYKWTGDLQPG